VQRRYLFVAIYEKEISLSQLISQATYHDLVIADARTDFNDYLLTSLNVSTKRYAGRCAISGIDELRAGKEPLSKIIYV